MMNLSHNERYPVWRDRPSRPVTNVFAIGIAVVFCSWFVSPVSERAVIDYQLISAISSNSPGEAILAFSSGADPNVQTYFRGMPWRGLTAVGLAGSYSGSVPVWVEYLWPETGKGHLPQDEKQQVLAVLLEHGANPNETSGGRPVLSLAVFYGFNNAAEELIAHGADTNLADFTGGTPLEYAVDANNADAVNLLIQHGAVLDTGNPTDAPLLTRAVIRTSYSCIEPLIGFGVDVNAEDSDGKTALDYAAICGPIADILRNVGAHSGSHRPQDRSTSTIGGSGPTRSGM